MPLEEALPIDSMVFWMIFSEVLSNALVASSKKSTDGFFINARASAMRCFCPPENCDPPEPTKVSTPSGSSFKKDNCAVRSTS
mmetsp:Transcript_2782/g.8281  ORF Transcript_2782/g.8281 Transcript_2782/m.8281 type:complete len:83 (-) Transcript_2782:460-708(-)